MLIEGSFKKKSYELIRDLFIFCCFTGLSWTDMANLTKENLQTSFDGHLWIKTNRQKTGTETNLRLLEVPLRIIKKYEGCSEDGKLLPVPCYPNCKNGIKVIAKKCGIEKNVTWHMSRHSFATTVCLSNDMPIETLSKMLGHRSIRTTQIYAKITAEKVSNDILLLPMEYVVNQYNDSSLPVYGSSFSFVSERNGYGSNATEDGSRLVYDLEGVDTYDLLAALTYDGWGYESMSHHVQATFSDGVPIEDLTVNDCLCDGSEEFRQKYDESGLNDRGVWLYEGRTCVLAPEDTFSMYPGLNPQNVKGMKSQISVIANMTYDIEASRVYVVASDIGSAGLEVSTLTEAKADGYVQTFPDGTWGKAVDNYCHEETICEDNSVTVRNIESKEIADGDAVRNVFEQIYRNTYYDSWNKVGSANNYWHSAHPTSLDVRMSFKLSDVNDKSAQLFKPLFPAYVYYWHAQEAVRYRIPVNFSYSTFKFVEVLDT